MLESRTFTTGDPKEVSVFKPRLHIQLLLASVILTCMTGRLGAQKGEIDLVGHAHIDPSWLWPRSETIHEVCPLTF